MWQPVFNAPFDHDIEVAVINEDGTHPIVFPCRRVQEGWIDARSSKRLDINPTHWRDWQHRPGSRPPVSP